MIMNETEIKALKELGYTVVSNQDGYKVFLGGEWIYGASVDLPRRKRLHWRQARANRALMYDLGWMAARDHHAREMKL